MMVDSDPTDRADTTDRAGTAADTEAKPTGRKAWRRGPVEDNAGWAVFSYLISGMVFYGLVGWLVSRATHIGILFPLGMIVGLILAIVLIIFRYGRP
jgi:F0F1-type ATP synthase assembly protein I